MTRGRPKIVIATALATLAVTACSGAQEESHTITGELELISDSVSWAPVEDTCQGAEGFGDISAGTQVEVTNEEGDVIGVGSLDQGAFDDDLGTWRCTFTFTVRDVPDATIYGVEVSHRGALHFTRAEMEANDWSVQLSLGS